MDDNRFFELGAIIFGLTEVIKEFIPAKIRSKVTPLIAILIGGGANVYLNGYSPENVIYGLALGLAASGMYKAVRNTLTGPSVVSVEPGKNPVKITSEKSS